MGWGSATEIFDSVCNVLLVDGPVDQEGVLKALIKQLEYEDWDCQDESDYYDHPLVRKIMKERHPAWFEEEE